MRLIFSLIIILFSVQLSYASTNWYVRDGGGTGTQCTGKINSVYPGTGTAQPCAFNHPAWALGTFGAAGPAPVAGVMVGGDTLSIDGDSDLNPGTQAQYIIGWGMPNTSGGGCTQVYAYTCGMNPIPPGPDSAHETTIIGTGTQKPQLYGTQGIFYILIATPNNPPSSGTLTLVSGHGGGTSPISYSASNQYIYYFTVSGITNSPTVGDTYTNSGSTFTLTAVNISGGSGTFVGTTSAGSPRGPSGTLVVTHGSGDSSISYSNYAFANFTFTVTGVTTPPSVGDEYTTSGVTYDVVATNIKTGSGSLGFNAEENVDMENMELTQQDSCTAIDLTDSGADGFPASCGGTDGSYPYGPWAHFGISLEGNNIVTKNMWIHRIAKDDFWFPGTVGNWSSTNDRFTSSGEALDNGAPYMSFGGNNTMTNDVWAFGGCLEHYPTPNPGNVKDTTNYVHCADQNNSGLGGGFMQQADQGACGNWVVNGTQFLFNLKTNWDFLHCDGSGTVNIYRSRSEGSSGEALKLGVHTVHVEESQLIGNAPVWTTPAFTAIAHNLPIICRGEAITNFYTNNGMSVNFVNSDITGNCTALLLTSSPLDQCTGATINATNTKFIGGYSYGNGDNEQVDLIYFGGTTGNNDGPCGTSTAIPFNERNDSCYSIHPYAGFDCTNGTNTITADPLILGEQTSSLVDLLGPDAYYIGTSLGDLFYLQSSSPLRGQSFTGVTYTNPSGKIDYNGFSPTANPWDIGAIQYNSCIAQTDFCSISGQCCGGNCNSEGFCGSGSCTVNNGACLVGTDCCSGICCANVCESSCSANLQIIDQLTGQCSTVGKVGF